LNEAGVGVAVHPNIDLAQLLSIGSGAGSTAAFEQQSHARRNAA
jgi:hypothetical protein